MDASYEIYKMLSILSVMLVIITETNAGSHLYNDICATVSKSNISSRVAIVECHPGSVTFDPKSQKGAFPFDANTGSWTGEIFTCQCSCRLPNNFLNGWIKGMIHHGEILEYSCDTGFEKKIKEIIVCYDGLLLIIPNYSEYSHINASFRQTSLTEMLADDFQGHIFHLELNATANWSLPESEVRYNQKVYGILANETQLLYYLYNGSSYQYGKVDLKMHQIVECVKKIDSRTNMMHPEVFESKSLPVWIIVAIVFAIIIVLIAVVDWVFPKIKKFCVNVG